MTNDHPTSSLTNAWLNVEQARKLTGLSRSTLQRRVRDGELDAQRDPQSGRVFYARDQLESLHRLRAVRPAAAPVPEAVPEPPSIELLQRLLEAFDSGTSLAELVREGYEPAQITAASRHLRESQRKLEEDRVAWKQDQLSVTLTGEDLRLLSSFLNGPPLRDRKSLLEAVRLTVTEFWEREEQRDGDRRQASPTPRETSGGAAAT